MKALTELCTLVFLLAPQPKYSKSYASFGPAAQKCCIFSQIKPKCQKNQKVLVYMDILKAMVIQLFSLTFW